MRGARGREDRERRDDELGNERVLGREIPRHIDDGEREMAKGQGGG